jgi:type IV pilus assembly protein PilW
MEHFNIEKYNNNYGVTLIELLIALAISGLVMTAIYNIFVSNNLIYLKQNEMVNMEQNLRSALNLMSQEIRMAGYAPNATFSVGINSTSSERISFSFYDMYKNGTKHVEYELYDSGSYGENTLGRIVDDSKQPLIPNVNDMHFSYDDCSVKIFLEVYPEKNSLAISNLNMTKSVYVRNKCLNE